MLALSPRFHSFLWEVFNVTFIAAYQHVLLLLIALPAVLDLSAHLCVSLARARALSICLPSLSPPLSRPRTHGQVPVSHSFYSMTVAAHQ